MANRGVAPVSLVRWAMLEVLNTIWPIAQGILLVGGSALIYQVVKLQGRMLIRLDELERRVPPTAEAAGRAGLVVGTPITPFRLPDLQGRLISSTSLRGQRTLLIYWNFDCGFCDLLAPDLAQLHEALGRQNVRLVLASRSNPATSRSRAEEQRLTDAVLLLESDDPLATEAFQHQGTPVAYLLDEQGRVAQPLAVGGEAILDLAQSALPRSDERVRLPNERPLSESRIERNGLRVGTQAPLFVLPEVRGGTVALEDFRGRRVLLVLTDPQCGPCDDLLPHLVRVHQDQGDELAVILVARGDREDARRKADRQGLLFPVVLQERWNLAREYGIFAVPVAFLIGEDGVIAADVARGVDEILALVAQDQAVETVSDWGEKNNR